MKPAIPESVLQQHIAFLGKTGSGKTSTAKLAVEQIVRGNPQARICVLDPVKSDWWGLTSSADGKRPGLPFHILGGPRGHVPLHDSAGKAIGELVATGALPLSIIDMADFSAGGLQKFFNDFAPALMKKMRGVVYLVIEEAHEFAPKERSGIGAENMAIHWAKKLATAGRSKGIRMMVLTQRTQALHNALLGSCDTMIAHRLTAPADQEPVKKWLKANVDKEIFEKVSASLSSLKTGSAWICSGEAQVADLVQFPKITTYDNSATPTGEMDDLQIKTAPVDANKLRAIIGDAVKQAEADDPTKLRAEIARLARELASKPLTPAVDAHAVEIAEQRGFDRGFDEALARGIRAMGDLWSNILKPLSAAKMAFEEIEMIHEQLFDAVEGRSEGAPGLQGIPHESWTNITGKWPDIKNHLGRRGDEIYSESGSPPSQVTRPPVKLTAPTRAVSSSIRANPSSAASGDGSLPKGERLCLNAIAQNRNGVTRQQLTVITGYKRSTRDAYLQRLREKQYITEDAGRIHPTNIGLEALGPFDLLPTGEALQQHVLSTLPEGERAVLACIIPAYPKPVDRDVISDATGYKRSTRDAYIQRLSTRELVAAERGAVRASADLFE